MTSDDGAETHTSVQVDLEKLTELVPGMVYQFRLEADGRARLPYVSRGIRDLFGLSPADVEVNAEPVFACIHPEDREAFHASIQESAASLHPWMHEFRVALPEGEVRWLRAHANPERLDDGATVWHGFVTNVTERRTQEERLRQREQVLQRMTDALQDLVVMADAERRITFVTPSVRTVLGLDPDELPGTPVLDLFADHERPRVAEALNVAQQEPGGHALEARGAHRDGHDVWLDTTFEWLGSGEGVVLASRDVTDRIRDRQALEREAAYRRALVEITNDMLSARLDKGFYQQLMKRTIEVVPDAEGGSMVLWDDAGHYRFVAAEEFDLDVLRELRLEPDEIGRSHPPRVERIQVHDTHGRLSEKKVEVFRRAGNLLDIKMTLSVPILAAGEPRGFMNLDNFHDEDAFGAEAIEVAEALAAQVGIALQRLQLEDWLEEERARYRHLASHDPLTGLPNRRLFQDRLDQATLRAQRRSLRVGLVYVDLNAFKSVNDSYGHGVGDDLLVEVARRLQTQVRAEDTVARLGGDEFAVVLSDLPSPDDAQRIIDAFAHELRVPYVLDGRGLRVDASLGVAFYPDDGTDREALMRAADDAMYAAKPNRTRDLRGHA
ncbi:MAG: diguanylate cyclase [Trueperaceae bacterium]|nr:diguanylate cyclase [Trueperaceae bacterium]